MIHSFTSQHTIPSPSPSPCHTIKHYIKASKKVDGFKINRDGINQWIIRFAFLLVNKNAIE